MRGLETPGHGGRHVGPRAAAPERSPPRGPRARRRIVAAVAGATTVAAAWALPATAQVTAPQGVVQAALVGNVRPALTAGLRWTWTPPSEPVVDPDTGVAMVEGSYWSFQAMGTAGVTFARPRGRTVDLAALLQASLLRAVGEGLVGGVGPTVLGSFRPAGVGAGVRAEVAQKAAGASAGAFWNDDRHAWKAFLALDVSIALLRDALNLR